MRKSSIKIMTFSSKKDLENKATTEAVEIQRRNELLEIVVTDMKPIPTESRELLEAAPGDLGYASVMFVYEA